MHLCKSFLLPAVILFLFFSPLFSATYYVAKTGNDNNTGTEELSWLTVNKAANTLQAGDTVYIKAGTYNEFVYIQNSGSAADGYITFQNYGNDEVIIDGSGLGGGSLVYIEAKSYIKLIGLNTINHNGNGIRVDAPADHIEIRNCSVKNGSPNSGAVKEGQTHAFLLFAWKERYGSISDVIIDGNEVADNNTSGNESLTLWGEVSNFKVINNIVHDGTNICMDMIGRDVYYGDVMGRPHNGVVKGNTAYNSGSGSWGSGIYGDGAGYPDMPNNIIIEDNISFGNDFCGIEIGDEHDGEFSGGILIRRNICYGNNHYGIQVGGGGTGAGGTVQNCTFIHNICYQNGYGELTINPSSNITYKNNIFERRELNQTGGFIYWTAGAATGNTANYNLWYPDGEFQWEGHSYANLAAFQSGSGQGANSIMADPQMVDPDNANFQLNSSSTAIDAGAFLTTTASSGNGTEMSVLDARYFTDGMGLIEGDLIMVGASTARITDIDYNSNTLTIDQSLSWNQGDGVSYAYRGNAPDIGVFEYDSGSAHVKPAVKDYQSNPLKVYNPGFSRNVEISFKLDKLRKVNLKVCDLRGKTVKILFQGWKTAGMHTLTWSGMNTDSNPVSGGAYMVRLAMDNEVRQTVVMVK
jgi:hypothetical protein